MLKTLAVKLALANSSVVEGSLLCYLRSGRKEYQIPHQNMLTKKEFPGPHYEVKVTSLISALLGEDVSHEFHHVAERQSEFGDGKSFLKGLVEGRHIQIGDDLAPYLCCPNLPEENLLVCVELWLIHQFVYDAYKLNLNSFEAFVFHENSDFQDWLANGRSMDSISEYDRIFLLTHKKLFENVRKNYYDGLEGKHSFSIERFVDALKKSFNTEVEVKPL